MCTHWGDYLSWEASFLKNVTIFVMIVLFWVIDWIELCMHQISTIITMNHYHTISNRRWREKERGRISQLLFHNDVKLFRFKNSKNKTWLVIDKRNEWRGTWFPIIDMHNNNFEQRRLSWFFLKIYRNRELHFQDLAHHLFYQRLYLTIFP